MDWNTAFLILLGLCFLFLLGTVMAKPLKLLLRAVACLSLGVLLLLAVNTLLGGLGFHLALNPFTILAAGLLNIPGVVLLVVLKTLFV
jgi:inhibitor of the pro-sigma K processing machinery